METSWKTNLRSTDPKLRLQAVKTLTLSLDRRAIQILRHLYENDPDPTVRDFAKKGAQYIYQKTQATQEPTGPEDQAATRISASEHKPSQLKTEPPKKPVDEMSLSGEGIEPTEKSTSRQVQSANQKLQQALTQQMRGNTDKALKYLEAAFEINPALREDTFALNLASSLTGLPQQQVLAALEQNQASIIQSSPTPGVTTSPVEPGEDSAETTAQDFGKENKIEQSTRELLETVLAPGEKLLAYSGGVLPGLFSNKPIAAGITTRRLMIQPLKKNIKNGPALTIWRKCIESIKFSSIGSRLVVKVPQGSLIIITNKSYWKTRAKKFPEQLRSMPLGQTLPWPTGSQLEAQINGFEELGLINSALAISKTSPDPELGESSARFQKLTDQRFSYQVAAGFLLFNILIGLLFAFLGLISGIPILPSLFISAVIDLLIGLNLWKGQIQPWAGWALLRAGVGAVLYGILYISQGLYLDLLAQLSFCGAIILVLTGDRDRMRSYTAIGIYAIGFLGIITITFILGLLSGVGSY